MGAQPPSGDDAQSAGECVQTKGLFAETDLQSVVRECELHVAEWRNRLDFLTFIGLLASSRSSSSPPYTQLGGLYRRSDGLRGDRGTNS